VASDRGTIHIFSLRVRVAGEDESARPSTTPRLLNQTSSSSLEPLIAQIAGTNPSLSLPFVKGTKSLLVLFVVVYSLGYH